MKSLTTMAMLTAMVLAAHAGVALAHNHTNYYNGKWRPDASDRSVEWAFVDVSEPQGVPSAEGIRNRIRDAAEKWNAENRSMKFVESGPNWTAYQWDGCSPNYMANKIAWQHIDGTSNSFNIAAQTNVCVWTNDSSRNYNFKVRFDSADSWFSGTSTTVPPNQFDLWSIATHEFGHATGWLHHFDDPGFITTLCPGPGPTHHTMCRALEQGTYGGRSLETHDAHTFENAY